MSTGCNKRAWHKSVRIMYNFSTVVYTLFLIIHSNWTSQLKASIYCWTTIESTFCNGKQRWPWNFHPLPRYLTRNITISTCYEFVLRKTQVRSARGFNRWTRLPQTITFKCLPRGRIWSTATTRWGPTPVAGELSDLRLNAPFSPKNEGVFLFQTLVPKKSPQTLISNISISFWGLGKSRSPFLLPQLQLETRKMTPHRGRNARGRWRRMRRRRGTLSEGKGSIWLFTNFHGKISQHRSFDKC